MADIVGGEEIPSLMLAVTGFALKCIHPDWFGSSTLWSFHELEKSEGADWLDQNKMLFLQRKRA